MMGRNISTLAGINSEVAPRQCRSLRLLAPASTTNHTGQAAFGLSVRDLDKRG